MNNKIIDLDSLTRYDENLKELLTTNNLFYNKLGDGMRFDLDTAKKGVYILNGSSIDGFLYHTGTYDLAISNYYPLIIVITKEFSLAEINEIFGYTILVGASTNRYGQLFSANLKKVDETLKKIDLASLDTFGRWNIALLTSNAQNISGEKTFTIIPKVNMNSTPTNNWQLAPKKYVDDTMYLANTYSTIETKIGTYLGNDLYRIVITLTGTEYDNLSTVGSTSTTRVYPISSLNIDSLIRGDVKIKQTEASTNTVSCKTFPMHRVNTSDNYDCGIPKYDSAGDLSLYVGSGARNNLSGNIEIILEYTKNTSA